MTKKRHIREAGRYKLYHYLLPFIDTFIRIPPGRIISIKKDMLTPDKRIMPLLPLRVLLMSPTCDYITVT